MFLNQWFFLNVSFSLTTSLCVCVDTPSIHVSVDEVRRRGTLRLLNNSQPPRAQKINITKPFSKAPAGSCIPVISTCITQAAAVRFRLRPQLTSSSFSLPTEPGQQKTFKRKRSLINWPFWKGSNTQLDGLPLSPTSLSPTQGRLFGRPLSSVCTAEPGLPKPVMVSWVQVTQASKRGSGPRLEGSEDDLGFAVYLGKGRCSGVRKWILSELSLLAIHYVSDRLFKFWTTNEISNGRAGGSGEVKPQSVD